jgi:error-prone DNA polymerase
MSGTPPYAELHCHSAYSFLDGSSLPEELAAVAQKLGYGALALTDHNSVSGSMELAKSLESAPVRAIHGAEVDVVADDRGALDRAGVGVHHLADRAVAGVRHLTLLVRDARGWSNLCRILTLAHARTREGRERAEPSVALGAVLDHAEGLVCLTGCVAHGVHDEPTMRRLLDAFGPESLRVELQRPYARYDRARNRALAALARRLGVACVATGDVHAHAPSRAPLQDAFVALHHHTTLDACEPLRRGNHSHAMSMPQAMANRFADHPDAVRETVCLAEELRFDLTRDLGYRYPGAEDSSSQRRLVELCRARLEDRYGPASGVGHACAEQAHLRLEQELGVIEKLGLAGFFLLHHDMLELAREVALEVRGADSARALLAPGRGRGSSVSSIVCYLTGLSHIDPVANGLLLGRFLHEELSDLPDIDLDFPREVREVLIPRVHERYGRERTALVAAFPTFRVRGAVRELGKVLGLPAGEIERVARGCDSHGRGVEHDIATVLGGARPDHRLRRRPAGTGRSVRWRWLAHLVDEAYGLPRHLSQHSGGMVLATRPLIDCCPVVPAAMEGRQMVQWDKDSCADAGFLKIDLLGLGMLSAVERCVEEIARTRSQRIDLSRIPFDEPQTFEAIRRADTVGSFQIESRAQMQSIRRTQPENLDDLVTQVAIVRPGPIQGGAVHPYMERRRRLREDPSYEIPYEHPSLEPVLQSTLGAIIFQDQVMQVAEVFAGFSPGEAAGLRRAMSRKRSHEMLQCHRERFIEGALRHARADAHTAERVWEMVSGFAGFGFPKAHAAAFGLLAYQSTWLRVHYGPEFLCALLNEQPMGFYAPDSLVHEAQRRGIRVLGLDVNASQAQCTAQNGGVRLGLGYVRGALAAEVRELVAERERGGPFRSLGDLAARAGAGRVTLERLAWSGACDSLVDANEVAGKDAGATAGEATGGMAQETAGRTAPGARSSWERRRVALWQLGIAAPGTSTRTGTQLALPMELPDSPRLRSLSRWQRLIADYATSGVTVADHVMAALRPRLTARMLVTSAQLARLPQGCSVTVAGLVIARQRPGTARGTMFLLFEDEWGTINLIVPRAAYERHRHLARAEPLLLARGRLERHCVLPVSPAGMTGEDQGAQEMVPPILNVIVRELQALERLLPACVTEAGAQAQVRRLAGRGRPPASAAEKEQGDVQVAAAMRAVAPPVQSFAAGRRR